MLSISRPFRLLPLVLVAAMVAIGLVLEATVHDTLLWQTKLPVVVLLAWVFARRREG